MNRKLLAICLVFVTVSAIAFQVGGVAAQQDGIGNQSTASGLTVTELTAPTSAAPGENVTVLAIVSNPTDDRQTESVAFRVGGTVVDRQLVTVAANESQAVRLSASTAGLDPGTYVHGVFTETDGQVAEITLSESYTLDSLEAPSSVVQGETVVVNATVTNPNNFTTTQDVEFRLAGDLVASSSVTLNESETALVSFEVPTDDIEPGTYVHSVFTRDGGAFAELEVTSEIVTETPTETSTETATESPTETSTETATETAS